MKLIRFASTSLAAVALSFACGCSTQAPTAGLARGAHGARGQSDAVRTPADPNVTGTTSLMSAQVSGPAPRVGKAHLSVDDEVEATSGSSRVADGPKTPRRSDGSRRGGGFGSSK